MWILGARHHPDIALAPRYLKEDLCLLKFTRKFASTIFSSAYANADDWETIVYIQAKTTDIMGGNLSRKGVHKVGR